MSETLRPACFQEGAVFHVGNGVTFQRLPDGDVRVSVNGEVADVPRHIWASCVASVSRLGESHRTWTDALCLHNGHAPDSFAGRNWWKVQAQKADATEAQEEAAE